VIEKFSCLKHKGGMSSFGSFGLFGAKSLVIPAFPVHENFQLFSAVLVENRHADFGDMSSFVQELARSSCTSCKAQK